MAGNIVIADAGPLIALSRIGALHLLRDLFGTVLVTREVRAETLDAGWLCCPDLPENSWQPVNPGLGSGERSAIAAALTLADSLLIVDDRAARAEAQSLGLAIVGTAATVGLAKRQNLIPAARPLLERLRPAGYYIHPRIIEQVLKSAGEWGQATP